MTTYAQRHRIQGVANTNTEYLSKGLMMPTDSDSGRGSNRERQSWKRRRGQRRGRRRRHSATSTVAVAQFQLQLQLKPPSSILHPPSSIFGLLLGRITSSLVVFGQTRLLRQKPCMCFVSLRAQQPQIIATIIVIIIIIIVIMVIMVCVVVAALLGGLKQQLLTVLCRPGQTQRRVCRVSPRFPPLLRPLLLPFPIPFPPQRCIVPRSTAHLKCAQIVAHARS